MKITFRRGNKKIALAILALVITGCSTSITNHNSGGTESKSAIVLTANEIKEFEREYASFTAKSFSQAYLDKKLDLWLDTVNDVKLLKELLFSQFKHPDLAQAFFTAYPDKHTSILEKTEIINQINSDSPFSVFMNFNLISQVSTVAGGGTGDGNGTSAGFSDPYGITIDSTGNLYIAEYGGHKIRKIDTSGNVTTIAGSTAGFADGNGTNAKFTNPLDVILDSTGNLYIADYQGHKIRKIDTSGNVTTIAGDTSGFTDGNGTNARFFSPAGITIDSTGNLYVSEYGNDKIRKIDTSGNVTTIAGSTAGFADGNGTNAKFNNLVGITIDSTGNLYVAEHGNSKIRKIDTSLNVTTIAGSSSGFADGNGTSAKFNNPTGVTVDNTGNLYIGDQSNHRIRKIDTSTNHVVTTLAGSTSGFADGDLTTALFNAPVGITIDSTGNFYLAERSGKIRKIE